MSKMTKKGTENDMVNTKVCVFMGGTGAKEFALFEEYALQGCAIAFMDKNKEVGQKVKEELERLYEASVFFFHGDKESEEDVHLFTSAIDEMFGGTVFFICDNN